MKSSNLSTTVIYRTSMCLVTNQMSPSKATERITCYKMVLKDKKGDYKTPIQKTKIYVYPGSTQTAVGDASFEVRDGKSYVSHGYIHTFKGVDNRELKYLLSTATGLVKVWECYIPEGEDYVEGRTIINAQECYASRSIVYSRDITDELRKKENYVSVK